MENSAFIRVSTQHLSLWQSVVSDFIFEQHKRSNGSAGLNMLAVQQHPMMQASNKLMVQLDANNQVKLAGNENHLLTAPEDINLYLSSVCLELGGALARNNTALVKELEEKYRKYSDKDPGFLTCATTYAEYFVKYKGVLKYNDWQIQGKGRMDYGTIKYRLPNDAKVAILGDWGTGMEDAKCLLRQIINQHKPDAIIHLGDIYYSGTPEECKRNFSAIFDEVFKESPDKKRIPVFSIPGNHDYYAFGYDYYKMVTDLNSFLPDAVQHASYFSLRTEDDGWQFLGMDTGFHDASPGNQFDAFYAGPKLHQSEVIWLRDKLNSFNGASILLSHHQLFTANGKINGSLSEYKNFPFLNTYLYEYFQSYFSTKIAGWLWGHEHNLVLYKDKLAGLQKGRLVGCSAFEELSSADPYEIKYPQVPYLDPEKYRLDAEMGYYNHGYAIVDLGVRKHPGDNVKVSYHQYPSWASMPGAELPALPKEAPLVYSEYFAKPNPVKQPALAYNKGLMLSLNDLPFYFSNIESGKLLNHYATLGQPVQIELIGIGKEGGVHDGDLVNIKTTDPKAGDYNLLGAWKNHWLYYYKRTNSENEQWIINKVNQDGSSEIRYGDMIYFTNKKYSRQYLTPSDAKYLTTKKDMPTYWTCLMPDINLKQNKIDEKAEEIVI